jgi:hypothetical protein
MTRDQIAELERALQEAPLPGEGAARERARRTVLAAHAGRKPVRERRGAPLVWAAVAIVLAALVLTQHDSGPARAVERLVRDAVQAEPEAPRPAPTPVSGLALPAPGRLLVTGADGLFVVARDGHRTALGRWEAATWSPTGLFVAAAAGRTLAALDPTDGSVRWRLRPGGGVSFPRWAPDRTHIAYRAGHTLRIVEGDGDHDVAAGVNMAAVAPAWRPSDWHTVAWASETGVVTVEDADTAKVLWRRTGGAVRLLAWSADGRRLLIAGRRHGTIHDLTGGSSQRLALAAGEELVAAAFAPTGNRLALAVHDAAGDRTEVRVRGRRLFDTPGRLHGLEWSPDGGWLLAGRPAADEWLLLPASGRPRAAAAVTGITRRFGAGARTHGWCC